MGTEAPAELTSDDTFARDGLASWAIAIALVVFWVAYVHATQALDNDFGWQLKAGQLILAGHPLQWTDVFSWTAAGKPWLDPEWLSQWLFAWGDRLGGYAAIKLGYTALMLGVWGLCAACFRRSGLSLALSAFAATAVGFQLYWQCWPRALGATMLGMAFTVWLLHRHARTGRLGWAGAVYPIAVIVWANAHPGAIAGPATCLVYAAGAWLGRAGWPRKRLLVMTALAGLALFVTPNGVAEVALAFAPMLDPAVRAMNRLNDEWSPFDFGNWLHRYFALDVAVVLGAAALGRKWLDWRRVSGLVVLAAFWLVMAAFTQRHVPLAAIALVPFAAEALGAAKQAVATRAIAPRRAFQALGAVLALVIWLNPSTIALWRYRFLPCEQVFPSPAALQALHGLGPDRRLLNDYEWGGYLTLTGYPLTKVFIDGRQYVYGLAINQDYATMMGARPGWDRLLAGYGVDTVFASPEQPLVAALAHSAGWRQVYQDPSAVLFLRRPGGR